MTSQKWLIKNEKTLFGVAYCPEKISSAALLMPGFGMHMCDVDYFMSKLARRLYTAGVYVLLLDPYGHGDSYGDLQDSTISSLVEDIRIGIESCKSVSKNTHCFSRGLIANLLASAASDVKIIGMSPILTDPKELGSLEIPKVCDEIYNFAPGDDYIAYSNFDSNKLSLIEMIGGRIRHMHGQHIDPDILQYVVSTDHLRTLKTHNDAHWIFYESGVDIRYKIYCSNELKYRDLSSYFKTAIYRDAMWQYQIIEAIAKMICN